MVESLEKFASRYELPACIAHLLAERSVIPSFHVGRTRFVSSQGDSLFLKRVKESNVLKENIEQAARPPSPVENKMFVEDFCEKYAITVRTFRRMKSKGEIKTIKIGRRDMITPKAERDFIQRKEEAAGIF